MKNNTLVLASLVSSSISMALSIYIAIKLNTFDVNVTSSSSPITSSPITSSSITSDATKSNTGSSANLFNDMSEVLDRSRDYQTTLISGGYPITGHLVVFEDPLCNYCKLLHKETLRSIENIVKEDGFGLNLVLTRRHYIIFGDRSFNLAKIQACAGLVGGRELYYQAIDILYQDDSSNKSTEDIVKLFSLPENKKKDILDCVQDKNELGPTAALNIYQDTQTANRIRAGGTPHVIVNGIVIGGYASQSEMVKRIKEAGLGQITIEESTPNPPISISSSDILTGVNEYQIEGIHVGAPITYTIAVFSDPKCPYSKMLYKDTIDALRKNKTHNLVIVHRYMSVLGDHSEYILSLLDCVGQHKPDLFVNTLYDIYLSNLDDKTIEDKILYTIGMDNKDACLIKAKEKVAKETNIAQGLGGNGTPFIIFGQKPVNGYIDYNTAIELMK
ncbi:MAG: thioredoxin domain-containing protein [Methylacidiphilales bacterium]|nr:thioredoxin domain-containing protein [Candidatus Methylacidiphilales bacterium]